MTIVTTSKTIRLKKETLQLIEEARKEIIEHNPKLQNLINSDEFVIRYALVNYIES